jgi:hypothetical protein
MKGKTVGNAVIGMASRHFVIARTNSTEANSDYLLQEGLTERFEKMIVS